MRRGKEKEADNFNKADKVINHKAGEDGHVERCGATMINRGNISFELPDKNPYSRFAAIEGCNVKRGLASIVLGVDSDAQLNKRANAINISFAGKAMHNGIAVWEPRLHRGAELLHQHAGRFSVIPHDGNV